MSKKCRAFSLSKIGLEQQNNRKAFYAGWDAAMQASRDVEAKQPVAVELTDSEIIEAYESEQQGRWGDHVRSLRAVIAAHEAKKVEVCDDSA